MRLPNVFRRLRRSAPLARWRFGIGLIIRDSSITIAVIWHSKSKWTATLPRDRARPLEEQVAAAVGLVPKRYLRIRRNIVVVIGGSGAHVKCISGIPAASKLALRQIVATGAHRFFPGAVGSLVAGGVRPSGNGLWAAVYAQDVVEAVRNGCAALGTSYVDLIPLAAALGVPGADSRVVLEDSGVEVRLRYDEGGQLLQLERRLADGRAEPRPVAAAAMASTPTEPAHHDVAAATMAVLHGRREPLGLRIVTSRTRDRSRLRLSVAATACVVGLVGAIAAPGLIANRQLRATTSELRAVAPKRALALQAKWEVSRATQGLAELAEFDDRNVPVSLLLARISSALPPGAALITLQVDTVAGVAVVVGPRATDVVGAFEHIAGIGSPTIVGPVTPETAPAIPGVGGVSHGPAMDRVTIRFLRQRIS